MSFLSRLYRFALKRLLGPYLVDNDIAMSNFNVSLGEKKVELRQLVLDVEALNSLLSLDDFFISSASIKSVLLILGEVPMLRLSGVAIVLEAKKSSASFTKKSVVLEVDPVAEVDDITTSSVSGSLGVIETWVESLSASIQIEVLDCTTTLHIGESDAHRLKLTIQRILSVNSNSSRQTDVFNVSFGILQGEDYFELVKTDQISIRTTQNMGDYTLVSSPMPNRLFAEVIEVCITPQSFALALEFSKQIAGLEQQRGGKRQSNASLSPSALFIMECKQVLVQVVSPPHSFTVEGKGLYADNSSIALHRIAVNFPREEDMYITLVPNEELHDLHYWFASERLQLAFSLSMGTSPEMKTLNDLALAFRQPPSSVDASSGSSRFVLESFPAVRIIIETQADDVMIELSELTFEESTLSIKKGVVWLRGDENGNGEDFPIFFLNKNLHVNFLTSSSLHPNDKVKDGKGDEDEPLPDFCQKLESHALQVCESIWDISLGALTTPNPLDVSLYQRCVAVLLLVGGSSASSTSTSRPPDSSLVVRSNCNAITLQLGRLEDKDDVVQFEAYEFTSFSFEFTSLVQVQHLVCSEMCTGKVVPLCFSSPYSSWDGSSLLALLDLTTTRCQVNHVVFRVEPQSTGFTRFAEYFSPSTTSSSATPNDPPSKLDCVLTQCVVDVFPSESPFISPTDCSVPLSRLQLYCGKVIVSLVAPGGGVSKQRINLELEDNQLYIANKSTRSDDEHLVSYGARKVMGTHDEYAIKSGFVRIGQWIRTVVFLRLDGKCTEVELDMKDGQLMTCPDSFQVLSTLVEYLGSLGDQQESFSPSSSIDLQANSSLSASDLRKHLANAPDSSLSASQLTQRYHTRDVHLTPFVVEEFYTIGSLPLAPAKRSATAREAARPSSRMFKRDEDEEEEWVFADVDSPQQKPAMHTTNAAPAASKGIFRMDSEEDDRDLMRNSFLFATVTEMRSTSAMTTEGLVQLVGREEISQGVERKNKKFLSLNASMQAIIEDIQETQSATERVVETEKQLYQSMLWTPGQALEHGGDDDDDEEEEEVIVDGKYFAENMDSHPILRHYIPVPRVAQPGSFVPPPQTIHLLKEELVRGAFRFIVRNANFTWVLFGGSDFLDEEDEDSLEPYLPFASEANSSPTSLHLLVVEDYFSTSKPHLASTIPPPMPSSSTRSGKTRKSKRDIANVVECIISQVSLVFDSYEKGAMSLCVSVHDVEIRDDVKTSPFKHVLHFWDKEPRMTGADMLRFTYKVNTQQHVSFRASCLPLRLIFHQDTMDLLSLFAFHTESNRNKKENVETHFALFDFRALKVKIDFFPRGIQLNKLKEGDYVEYARLFNYEGVEVALKPAVFEGIDGTSKLLEEWMNFWAKDVYNKQLARILAGVSPGLANVATDMANVVLLPAHVITTQGLKPAAAEAFKLGGQFAKTIVTETMGVSHRLVQGGLNVLDDSRSRRIPKNAEEGVYMAGQALASRAKQTQHTIVAVPLMTFQREGASGAVKSVIRAIPIAILQPFLGVGEAVEALSSGAKHSLRPEAYIQETTKWKH